MCNKGTTYRYNSGGSVHTLAQLRQSDENLKNYRKRARAKYFTNHLVFKLVDLDSPLKDGYWDSYHCSNIITQSEGALTSKYCNNRWCQVCNRIRTAKSIKGYLPKIQEMTDPYLVTLSRPNVTAEELPSEIDKIQKAFKSIQNHFRRTRKQTLYGLKKLECTYNYRRNDYHPHLHIMVEGGEEVAAAIVDRWLETNESSSIKGQDYRSIDKDNNGALEMFKYFTKLTTKIKTEKGETTYIHPESLDTIFRAMKGRRVYQPIGGMRKVNIDVEELQKDEIDELNKSVEELWEYDTEFADWISQDGEVLTGYTPSEAMDKIVSKSEYKGKYNEIVITNEKERHSRRNKTRLQDKAFRAKAENLYQEEIAETIP